MFDFLLNYIPLINWVYYVIIWVGLFIINLYIFNKLTPFDLKKDILDTKSKALWYIIRWQIIGQAIMIWVLIYFLWETYTKETLYLNQILKDTMNMIYFWLLWIFLFQLTIHIISKKINLYKEIILEENESLWMIIWWILISISIIISLSLYSY